VPPVWDDGQVEDDPGTRRQRRSKDELRELVMTAGLRILDEEGLGIAIADLTFKRVFERVEADTGVRLTNASIIRRVWENQSDFQSDLLSAIASASNSTGEMDSTVFALAPLLGGLDLSTPEARLAAMREICRVAGRTAFDALTESRGWALWVGVWVLAATGAPGTVDPRIRDALVRGYLAGTEEWVAMHQGLLDIMGLRPRAPLTLRDFTVSTGALIEGCVLRQVGAEDLPVIVRPTGPGGAPQEWTLFAIGLEALARQFFEPDPDWVPPAT
jgi:hypothetical protein